MNSTVSRRRFIHSSFCAGCALSLGNVLLTREQAWSANQPPMAEDVSDHEARHYEKMEGKKVLCKLCPKECRVADQERGYCGVRENIGGVYKTLVYGRPCSLHVDPIEKKPLFHYLPGSAAFSLATAGCNIECKFCQNWDISQFRPEQIRMFDLSPQATAQLAKETRSQTIAYTYSEPVIFYEYMLDAAIEGRKNGIGSVMISNGYIQEKPLRELLPHLTGVKIDFKAFTETFYKEVCNGELAPVLEALKIIRAMNKWLELVVLIIPTLNDSDAENRDMAKWILDNLGPDVPIHLTRYHPMYKMKNIPNTPERTLERLRKIMKDEGLHYVYIGNVPGHPAENTHCPKCDELLIRRLGYRIMMEGLENGECKKCHTKIVGVWTDPVS
ncbi:MAG: AmmeMemoRadiSam system radical SAM enzyme [Candidatus Omnitrophota bacterium]|jgi:pyruvate formate lyase activating enzyme|nr:MAG: AmmeMemoRadiSam system radical SAM enzyme [Candidatus Omnitrophota bacterium]